jgi:hypothetical protein
LNQIANENVKINENANQTPKVSAKNPTIEPNIPLLQEGTKPTTINVNKELPKNLKENNISDKVEKEPVHFNLSLARYVELKSHFDVVRKLGYLPNINSLVSISEVIK